MSPIRVLVVDDQAIVRDGLVTVLGFIPDLTVVAAASDGEEALALAELHEPDVVLMDLNMPGMDGTTATRTMLERRPDTAVLVLTTFADDVSILGALRAGARGYLTKDAGRAEIATAIRAVAQGQTTVEAAVAARLIAHLAPPSEGAAPAVSAPARPRFPQLTPREAQVLDLIAEGRTNAEIAAALFVTVPTVKSYVNQVFAKIGVSTRAEAVARVLR